MPLLIVAAVFLIVIAKSASVPQRLIDFNDYCELAEKLCYVNESLTYKHVACKEFEFSNNCPQQTTRTIFLDQEMRNLIVDVHNIYRNAVATGVLPGFNKKAIEMYAMVSFHQFNFETMILHNMA